MRKLMLLPLSLFAISCSSGDKEKQLLQKENELLKREIALDKKEKLIDTNSQKTVKKSSFYDWSGKYSVYNGEIEYGAVVYYGRTKQPWVSIITASGRQTYYVAQCNCEILRNDELVCKLDKVVEGSFVGDVPVNSKIFSIKKVGNNFVPMVLHHDFDKRYGDVLFKRTALPLDTIPFH